MADLSHDVVGTDSAAKADGRASSVLPQNSRGRVEKAAARLLMRSKKGLNFVAEPGIVCAILVQVLWTPLGFEREGFFQDFADLLHSFPRHARSL